MCGGGESGMSRAFHLAPSVDDYAYLARSGCTQIDGVSDGADFKELLSAMQLLHFTPTEIGHVFELVAAVLHLGNVRFRTTGDRECDIENEATSLWYARGQRSVTK